MPTAAESYVRRIAGQFGEYPQVLAVALAGSRGSDRADAQSDFDLYVYATRDLPVPFRRSLAGGHGEVGNRFWEHGDEWTDPASGARLDVMYRAPGWIEDQLDRVLHRHEASLGYSTCFWYNILNAEPLFDPRGWYRQLQDRARAPYPPELQRAIIARNWPVLRDNQSSYRRQIEIALRREDRVSVQHRVTALLAGVFDIWFALARQPHPGEKRLLGWLTAEWADAVRAVLDAPPRSLLGAIDALLDRVEAGISGLMA